MRVTADATLAELSVFARYQPGAGGVGVMSSLERRLAGRPVRAYFMDKMGQWAVASLPVWRRKRWEGGVREHLLRRQLPLIWEAVITIQYLHNQILDGKSGVTTRERISERLLWANLLKDQLYRYIDGEVPAAYRPAVMASTRRCFSWVDYGQVLEKRTNHRPSGEPELSDWPSLLPAQVRQSLDLAAAQVFIDKVKRDLPTLRHEAVDLYFQRIFLTCAFLFVEGADLLIRLTRPKSDVAASLRGFSLNYGLMRQLVNDNADWLPSAFALHTRAKEATDGFSDLRNGTLTLPLLFYLAANKHSPIQRMLASGAAWTPQLETRVFTEMLQSQALYQSIQNTRILGELAMAFLPDELPAARFLADTCEIVHWNKFLAPCLRHPAYAAYKKTPYHHRTRRLIRRLRRQRRQPNPAPARQAWPWSRPCLVTPRVQLAYELLGTHF